jgi:alanyl-tRNA synthetase
LQQLKEQAAQEVQIFSSKAVDINGVKLLVSELADVEPKMLRTMVDDLKNQLRVYRYRSGNGSRR